MTKLRSPRELFPSAGPDYELFDCSVFLLVFGLVGFLVTKPTATQATALEAPLRFVSEAQLGWALTFVALAGIVVAYADRLPRKPINMIWWGYVPVITISLALCLNYFVGWLTTDESGRAILSALVYGWIARRLISQQPIKVSAG